MELSTVMAVTVADVGRTVTWSDRGRRRTGILHQVPEAGTSSWWRGGVEVVVQGFVTYYLCRPCCESVLTGDDPPRKVITLPHALDDETRAARRRRAEAVAELQEAQLSMGDWGRRP